MKKIDHFLKGQKELPEIKPGDEVKVYYRIKEGEKERVQVFSGIVIAKKKKKEIGSTITVRKVVSGVGVEKIFPIFSPRLEKIEILKKGERKRAKLYHLREKQ
jgi:large subunit ribosomal protein L19